MSISLLARAAGLAKGLFGGAKVAAGAKAAGAAAKGLQGRRMAAQALHSYMGGPVNATNLAVNFGMDAGFGVMQGIATPGDLGDKVIAGTASAVGGALGGIGAVSALGKHKNNAGLRMMGEFGGGWGGDMVGQMGGDMLLRAKGGGTTPWEKVQMDSDQQYRQQLERELMAQYGIGGYQPTDLIDSTGGLA